MHVREYRAAATILASVLLAAAPGSADPRSAARRASCWATSAWASGADDNFVPLAVVHGQAFAHFVYCNEATWVDEGASPWLALDAWGKVSGTLELASRPNRSPLHVLTGTLGVGVYVSRAHWTAPPSARWEPSASDAASFARWRTRRRDDSGNAQGQARFFAGGTPRREFAVVAGFEHLWIVEHTGSAQWRAVHEEADTGASPWRAYALRAVVDMTGDGMPEVIYHFNEYQDGRGHDVVLTASRDGRQWREASNNFDDCP